MNYTVSVNEAKKEIVVMLDGYKGVAKCCPTDNFNLGTGIELALERAKVAKAEANKPKPSVSVAEAIKVLENHVGNHIAIIGGGWKMSEAQKAELRRYADMYAPIPHECSCDCCSQSEAYDEGYTEGYDEGYEAGYDKGYGIAKDECEDEIVEGELDEISELAARMVRRIREILDK